MHYFKGIKVIFMLLFALQVFASQCESTLEKPCIVQDSISQYAPLLWIRDASMITGNYHGNTIGLDSLYLSGSEAPSEKGWRDLAEYIAKRKPDSVRRVVVVDLRQESHGYLNGRAITLANDHNWINLGKTNAQSLSDQESWLNSLRTKKLLNGVLMQSQHRDKDYQHGKSIPVGVVKNEEYYVTKWGLEYQHLFISDHHAPQDSEVDSFLKLVVSKPKKTWFHFHCRGGKGRTTTLLAMYDMLKNADRVSFDEIIARHASITPYYNLQEIDRRDADLTYLYIKRILFLKSFYAYAQDRLHGYPGIWSEWKSQFE